MKELDKKAKELVDAIGFDGENVSELVNAFTKMSKTKLLELCPKCNSDNLYKTSNLLCGPYGGHIKCESCGYEASGYKYWFDQFVCITPIEDE